MHDPRRLLDRCAARLGDPFTLDLSILSPRTVVVSDPELVREVLTAPADVLSAGDASALFEPFVGSGSLFLLDGPEHVRHRRLLGPAFRAEHMPAYFEAMVAAVDHALDAVPEGRQVSFYELTRNLTLEVLALVVFGVEGAAGLADFRERARRMVDVCSRPFLMLRPARIDLGPWSPWGRVRVTMEELDTRIHRLIAEARAREAGRAAAANGQVAHRADVLSRLFAARDDNGGGLTDGELRDELVTLLVAGNETTATALAWTLDELLRAPDELAHVRRELDRVTGGGALRVEHMAELPRLDACIREALRLHPPIMNAIRVTRRPFSLGSWELPVGTDVAPCMYLTHRRADLYADPAAFRPARFLGVKADPHRFFPFGGGSRRCLGMTMTLYEARAVLARVLSRYQVTLASPQRPRAVRRAVLMAPSTGVPVRIERRG